MLFYDAICVFRKIFSYESGLSIKSLTISSSFIPLDALNKIKSPFDAFSFTAGGDLFLSVMADAVFLKLFQGAFRDKSSQFSVRKDAVNFIRADHSAALFMERFFKIAEFKHITEHEHFLP